MDCPRGRIGLRRLIAFSKTAPGLRRVAETSGGEAAGRRRRLVAVGHGRHRRAAKRQSRCQGLKRNHNQNSVFTARMTPLGRRLKALCEAEEEAAARSE